MIMIPIITIQRVMCPVTPNGCTLDQCKSCSCNLYIEDNRVVCDVDTQDGVSVNDI